MIGRCLIGRCLIGRCLIGHYLIGHCQKTGSSPAADALKPTPVTVSPEVVRAVMAWMPGPVRPCPPGVAVFQAEPLAEVHTTTS